MDKLKPPTEYSFEGNIAENWKRWIHAFEIFSIASGLREKRDEKRAEIKRYCENILLFLGIVKRHHDILASMCHELDVQIEEHLSKKLIKGSLT